MILLRLITFAVLLTACSILIAAQGSPTGIITGITQDAAGASVPGSRVVATNTKTNASFEAVSGSDGAYTIRSVPTGTYNVAVEATGFKKTNLTDVNVRVSEESRLDVTLTIGSVNEEVTITAETSQVNTTSSTLKTVIDERRINELPLNGRDPNALVQLVAGVQPDTRTSLTSGATYPGAVSVSSNGGRGNTTNYVLDGGSNNDSYSNQSNPTPNPDALQEFSVQTNNFSAEYGRNLGAVVNAVTKSGTNKFHGSAFEYVRNDALNATNFFSKHRRDGLKRNQFGGTIGGPLPLPHFGEGGPIFNSGKDRSFFFFSYQGTRTRQQPLDGSSVVVPTAAERATATSPVTQRLLQYIPLPNDPLPGSPGRYTFTVPIQLDDDQYMVRLDHKFNDSNSLFGRYWVSKASQPAFLDSANFLRTSFGRVWKNTIVALNDTHVFSPTVVNNTVFTFNKTDNANTHVYPPSLASMGSNYFNDAAPQIHVTVNNRFQLNTGDTNNFNRKEFQITNATRITTGNHYISVGGDYSYGTNDIVNNFRANGQWTFLTMADFMAGRFNTLLQGVGEYKSTIAHSPGFFIQDDWKLTKKLTLNLGLRWDPFIPYTDKNNKIAGFRPGEKSIVYPNAPVGLLYPGDPGLPVGGYNPSLANFGPRVGFAYDVTGDGKTSIRGGYGIFYDRPNTISTNSAANQAPFGTVITTDGNPAINSFSNPYGGTINPFPLSPNPPSNVAFNSFISVWSYDPDMRNAYIQSYNVSFEREIFPTYLVRVAYAGSKGSHLAMVREANAAVYTLGAQTNTTNIRRPLAPVFGSIATVEATGTSTYNSFQATVDKRFVKSFSILASYTLSKSEDESSENKQSGIVQTNPYSLEFDRGLSNFDHRHRFTASAVYALPGVSNKFANALIGNWNLTGILAMQSGAPFTVFSGVDNARSGTANQFADQVGDPNLPSGRTQGERIDAWFNTAAFIPNAFGTFGNAGRNTLTGPAFSSLNMGLHKSFALFEGTALQFRFEAFNVLNTVNFNPPNSTKSATAFGTLFSAQDPRILQLALRLTF